MTWFLISAFLLSAVSSVTPLSEFVLASDLSYVSVLDCYGACPLFQLNGTISDPFEIYKKAGYSTIRLRLWVDPPTETINPWPVRQVDSTYANTTNMIRTAQRVIDAGLNVWLDFHYSDNWADPGKQHKPSIWLNLSFAELVSTVNSYTYETIQAFVSAGVVPLIVQVGNEITAGLLWEEQNGKPCSNGGRISNSNGCDLNTQWLNVVSLLNAGITAVRSASPSSSIMIHTDLGNRLNSTGVDAIISWYTTLLSYSSMESFDLIGLSFYPMYGAGKSTNALKLNAALTAFPNHQIVLAETGYYNQGTTTPWDEFPLTPTGQNQFLQSLLTSAKQVGLMGVSYWGGEYFKDLAYSQFDSNANALPCLAS
jgi:arabinogalactan endo-1,4-beta-galactosidase